MNWPTSEEVIRQVARESGGTCLLSFSAGKDSAAAWLALRPHFTRIVPVYLYSVPGLEFVEVGLRYYEEFFETRIIRMPHPTLYRWLNNLVFQAPERCCVIEAARLPRVEYCHVERAVREDHKLPPDTPIAVGARACDSAQRFATFKRHGPRRGNKFFPVWDWNKARLVTELKSAGVKLPAEYRVFGRSWDGLDFRFLYGIKQHWPDDYRRILDYFPLAELEIKRYEFAMKHKEQAHAQEEKAG